MYTTQKPCIGLVSGIGPLAGADVYQKILFYASRAYDAKEDSDYPNVVLLNHGIEGFDNTGSLSLSFKNELCQMVEQLQNGGVNIIGIACNTAHVYYDELPVLPESTITHLVDPVAAQAAATDKPCLLLSSQTTRTQGLYTSFLKKHDVTCDTLPHKHQQVVDAVIGHVMAHNTIAGGRLLDVMLAYALTKGYRVIIAGCTELPLALTTSALASHFTVIDSNEVLARALVDSYYSAKVGG